jgi:hypothetical protein
MISRNSFKITGLFLVLAAAFMLVFWKSSLAQTQAENGAGKPPFASAVDQRSEMIRELKEIRALLKEQNVLLNQFLEQSHGTAKKK